MPKSTIDSRAEFLALLIDPNAPSAFTTVLLQNEQQCLYSIRFIQKWYIDQ
jgi:hypothetical protein